MSDIQMSTEAVGSTKDYSVFKYYDRNRIVSKTHVEDLKKDMALQGQLERVVVNEKWFVVDGQHRIEALKESKKPVDFRVKKGASMKDVVALNNTSVKWNTAAWVRNFSHPEHKNNKPYVLYSEFKKKYGLCDGICRLLLSEDFHDYGRKSFKNGTFKIKNYGKAANNAETLVDLVSVNKIFNSVRCAVGFLKIQNLKDFKINVLKNQSERYSNRIKYRVTVSDWVTGLFDMYNYNLKAPHKRLKMSLID